VTRYRNHWHLGGLSPLQLVHSVAAEIAANNFFGRASELAFDFLFALFPLILFMLNLFGLFASRSAELQNDFLSYFADFLPPMAYQLLAKTTTELAANSSGRNLAVGIVLAVWFASGGVSSMIPALNLAYRTRETRSWFKVRLVAVALTVVIAILLLAALFVVLVSGHFVDWLGAELRLQSVTAVWKAIQWPAAMFFVIISYSLIYFWGPNLDEHRWHWITPGSAFGTFVWWASSFVFTTYLRFFNSYSASYGSLGAVMILLVWLYVTALSFLIGGAINAEIDRAIARRGDPSAA
jgi:membrane protein